MLKKKIKLKQTMYV